MQNRPWLPQKPPLATQTQWQGAQTLRLGGANPAAGEANPTAGGANPAVTLPNPTAGAANPTATFQPPMIGFSPLFIKNAPFSTQIRSFTARDAVSFTLWDTPTNWHGEFPRSGAPVTAKNEDLKQTHQ